MSEEMKYRITVTPTNGELGFTTFEDDYNRAFEMCSGYAKTGAVVDLEERLVRHVKIGRFIDDAVLA